jgi:hypothetical protein
MTRILPIRLTDKEFAMLDEILSSDKCESENRSEWIRLLIHREWNKRKGLGVPKSQDYQTSFRLIALQGRYRELAIRRRICNTRSPAMKKNRLAGTPVIQQRRRNQSPALQISGCIPVGYKSLGKSISRRTPESKGVPRSNRLHKQRGTKFPLARSRGRRHGQTQ